MKKVSVVVICFNAEKTLKAALDSLVGQTYRNLEILVVDDGSDDDSVKIAEVFAREDERVRLICHRENRGILAARKTGVEAARGEWIMHLDADDFLLPQACELAVKAIEEKNTDFVQFGTLVSAEKNISQDEVIRKEKNLQAEKMDIDSKGNKDPFAILYACYKEHKFSYTQWNKIYSASLLKKAYGYIEADKINMSEDLYALFVITSMAKSMAVIEEKLYVYNFGNGISCVNKKNPMQAFERSCQTMKAVLATQDYVNKLQGKEKVNPLVLKLRKEMLHRSVTRFLPEIPGKHRLRAIRELGRWWSVRELLNFAVSRRFTNRFLQTSADRRLTNRFLQTSADRRFTNRLLHTSENPQRQSLVLKKRLFQTFLHKNVLCPDIRNY